MRIRSIAAGGDGVATLESGKTVFVPRTAPGDVVSIELVDERARWARGRVLRIEEPSADRVDPPCHHYETDRCGGCQLQHVSMAGQLRAKQRIVGDALRRIGGLGEIQDPPIVAAPEAWHYRARITLAGRGDRIGYHRYDAPDEVFDLVDCQLAGARLMSLWSELREHRNRFPEGIAALVLREDPDGGLHVVVESPGPQAWDATGLAAAVGDAAVTYWWRPRHGAARAVGGAPSKYSVEAFEQVQHAFGAQIRGGAVKALGSVDGLTVWDLYAGSGEGADELARAGAHVHAVELERSAVAAGRERTAGTSPGTVRWHAGRVEDLVGKLPEARAVFVNPPRTGLGGTVADALARWGEAVTGARVVYVSCDAATLARDLKRMPKFAPVQVTAFDLFPQTAHVETVVALEAA